MSYYRECQSKRDVDRMHYLCNKVANALRVPELSSDIKSVLSKLVYTYKQKLETSHKNFERCKNSNKNWFETFVTFPVPNTGQKRSSGSGGRPVKDFEDCSERMKRKKTEDVRKNLTPAELAFAAQMEYRAAGEVNKSKLIKDISTGTTLKSVDGPHARYTPDKALSLVIESHLTKHQYNLLRKSALELNCNLYPNYESVTEAKKKCYPEGIMCTEIKAEVSLQNLLNHTAERLLLSLKEVILHLHPNQRQDLCLISKWGCDGSGSHSQYKQKFQDQESSDEHMMVTTIVPIRVITTNNVLVWQNPRPSSPRYCRPLRLQMAPETSELSRQETTNLQLERADLLPTKNEEWCIKHDLKLTMVDGKMINALTDTSSAMRCYLCGATTKDFNKINVCLRKPVKTENLEYGISSLHAWIRLAECVLHLAYKLKLAKWQARGERDKEIVASEKKRIQKEFIEKLGLHVDKPRQGGGTSTDGNTARIMFQHAEEVSQITGINLNIINRLHTIL